jgi:hypothetical protein
LVVLRPLSRLRKGPRIAEDESSWRNGERNSECEAIRKAGSSAISVGGVSWPEWRYSPDHEDEELSSFAGEQQRGRGRTAWPMQARTAATWRSSLASEGSSGEERSFRPFKPFEEKQAGPTGQSRVRLGERAEPAVE